MPGLHPMSGPVASGVTRTPHRGGVMIGRSWGRTLLAVVATAALASGIPANTDAAPAEFQPPRPLSGPGTNHAFDDPFTADRTRWWREDRFGMFIHFGVYSHFGGEYRRPDGTICRDAEWIKRQCNIPQ